MTPRRVTTESDRHCPKGLCDGSGWVIDDDRLARQCPCQAERSRRAATRRLGTGVPKRFRGVSFERKPVCDLDPEIVRHVKRFVREIDGNLDAGNGLWFYGDKGTGKTSLAMLISQAAIDAGRSVAIYSVPHLLASIKHTYEADSGDSYMQLYERLCAVDLLHLDDLGAERRTDWVLEQLYTIVNARWQDERSIIVTTDETDFDKVREQIGARTVSRLSEICRQPIPVMGLDLREQSDRARHSA